MFPSGNWPPAVLDRAIDAATMRSAARTLEIEANAVTDNPLVLSDNSVVSGGNFHAAPVALEADR